MQSLQHFPPRATSQTAGCLFLFLLLFLSNACDKPAYGIIGGSAGSKLRSESFASFHGPWAMTFLPDGNLLVTEKSGSLVLFRLHDRSKVPIQGVPKVAYGGQGGLGDVILHPQYAENNLKA